MGKRDEPYYRFKLLKSVGRWNLFYDQESQSVPYVVIEKKKNWPQKTVDLMNVKAVLFSSEKLVDEYLKIQNKEKEYESSKSKSGTNEL
ncbi:hypothetical protein [Acetobacterium woodii]|uniref:hypothetical protein n=1 Tax=Acetobacterium woodii TaxID=33952 RepID=UPI0002F75075|nr:hypothetical protein [Acetobacterium woodii]